MVLFSLEKAIMGATKSHLWFEPILAGLVGYVLADLMIGVYHWGIDNYGSALTPIFGSQIDGFKHHHKWPWTITRIEFANPSQVVSLTVTFTVLPMVLASNDPIFHAFGAVCSSCIVFSLQFHAWAHTTKSQLPPLVIALQDMRLLVSPSKHANHHRLPYNNNYCLMSGV
ncbi:fatty acid desaturase 4, chloroplastic-like [Castanea sativa]|uniref:fatty acid desaturase 4, chloroplastic-like n=1 Tax=Castanea sativa TaxID=21020 RepID=UPI003F64F111